MKSLKFLSVILAVAIAVSACLTCAFAYTAGSITVTVEYGNAIIPSGVLTLYKVADLTSGGYSYTSQFANCGLDLSDLESSTLPWLLWSWVQSTGISGTSIAVGTDGTVTFTGLEEGIYLIVPSVNPTGYDMEPSLVSVPLDGDYSVEVISKIEPTSTPPDNPPPSTTTTVTEPDEEVTTTGENEEGGDVDVEIDDEPEENEEPEEENKLPQTGQLNYPIPIMAGTGALCVGAGLIITKTGKKK